MQRRPFLISSAAALVHGFAVAQTPAWPARPVRIVVAYPPGGSTDVAGRLLAQQLSTRLGQQVVVEATAGAGGLIDIPQLGRVILQDGVTIGACTTIDRGAYDDTVLGENSKIDNLVQIAHNVRIGRNCVLAGQAGISGSVIIGDGCQFGGRAGVADHFTIGDGARIGASGGVLKNVPAGETWSGFPAQPVQRWLREVAWVSRSAGRRRRGGD